MSPEEAAQRVFQNFDDHGIAATSEEEHNELRKSLKFELDWWLLQKNTKEEYRKWTEKTIKLIMYYVNSSYYY